MCAEAWGCNHIWTSARHAAIRRDRGCVRCGTPYRLEVNHIEPRNGAGYGNGCWHHQSGLETLCHRHHVEETNRQRAARRDGTPLPARMPAPALSLF